MFFPNPTNTKVRHIKVRQRKLPAHSAQVKSRPFGKSARNQSDWVRACQTAYQAKLRLVEYGVGHHTTRGLPSVAIELRPQRPHRTI